MYDPYSNQFELGLNRLVNPFQSQIVLTQGVFTFLKTSKNIENQKFDPQIIAKPM